ncbi:MAG: O-antigen ligase family protein [Actinobacteria bacterium]|nr:O-antigen ligase family protein [Actinomycetota bacterium]
MGSFGEVLLLAAPWTAIGLVIAFTVFLVVVGVEVPQLLIATSFGCYVVQMLNPSFAVVPGVIDLRLISVFIAGYLVLVRGRIPRVQTLRDGAFPASLVFFGIGFVTISTAMNIGVAFNALLAGLLCIVFVWFVVTAAEPDEIRSSIHIVSGLILIGSFVYVLVDPSAAKIHGRWAGLVSNANTLGAFSGIYFLSARPSRSLWSLPATIIGLIGSASRSSAFAVGLVAGPRLAENLGKRMRRVALVAALIVAIPIIHSVFFSAGDATGSTNGQHGGTLTRTGNTRIDQWTDGWHIFVDHIATGVGLGNEPHLLSSSVLSPLVQVGLMGMVPLAMLVSLAVRRAKGPRTVFRPMLAFLFVHGIFEMWLFAGGSAFFALLLIVAYDPELHALRRDGATEDEVVEADDDVVDDVLAWAPERRGGRHQPRPRLT